MSQAQKNEQMFKIFCFSSFEKEINNKVGVSSLERFLKTHHKISSVLYIIVQSFAGQLLDP